MTTTSRTQRVVLEAHGLGVRGGGTDWLFHGLDLSVTAGTVVQLDAEPGLARTAAILTLATRMVPDTGALRVLGESPTRADRRVGLGWIPGVRLYEDRGRADEVRALIRRVRRTVPSGAGPGNLERLGLEARQRAQGLPPLLQAMLGAAAAAALGPEVLVMELPLGTAAQRAAADRLVTTLAGRDLGLVIATEQSISAAQTHVLLAGPAG